METRRIMPLPLEGRVDREFDNGMLRQDVGTINSHGYKVIGIEGVNVRVHRLLYLEFVAGPIAPWHEIDHINGDRQNNCISNLRRSDRKKNSQNQRKAHKDSDSGLLGAYWHKKRKHWYAAMRIDGSVRYLGKFDTPELAHETYLAEKRVHHEGCTL